MVCEKGDRAVSIVRIIDRVEGVKLGTRRLVASKRPRAGGRPTPAQAARRDERLLDVATALFLKHGFEGTSIDALAQAARVSKPTIYARYRDKKALFIAVLRRRVDIANALILKPIAVEAGTGKSDRIETALHALSKRGVAQMLAPDNVILQRIVAAHAGGLPELAKFADDNRRKLVAQVAAALRHFAACGQVDINDPDMAADQFLSLVLGQPQRSVLYGRAITSRAAERYRKAAVELFLKAVQRRR